MMKIELLDSTLREGEQAPGVSFNVSQKLELAKMIDNFGVEYIELGHPAVSPDVRKAVEELSKLDLNAQKLIHGRATKGDIDDAKKYNVPWVGIFFGMCMIFFYFSFTHNFISHEKIFRSFAGLIYFIIVQV